MKLVVNKHEHEMLVCALAESIKRIEQDLSSAADFSGIKVGRKVKLEKLLKKVKECK